LKRQHTIFLDQTTNSPKVIRTLLEDVSSFELEFLDQKKQWVNSWSMFGNKENLQTLPKAIKLNIEAEPFGKIERLLIIANSEKPPEAVEESQ